MNDDRLFLHCNQSIEVRNPSGFCDHLYYPDLCIICQIIIESKDIIQQRLAQ